jgi:hypothetical protein
VKRCLVQHPVYFISMMPMDARLQYSQVQKLLLGVLLASCKLRHYFKSHRITVVNSYSLGRVLHNHSATGRIAEWAMELSGFDLHFTGATTIKSQALVDFVAEWTEYQSKRKHPPPPYPRRRIHDAGSCTSMGILPSREQELACFWFHLREITSST